MMDLATLHSVNRAATRKSQAERTVPALLTPEDVHAYRAGDEEAVCIPFIGYRVPKGYRTLGEPLFCDKSGFGDESESAWTLRRLLAHIESCGASYWGSTEEGQFQIYVQQYERKPVTRKEWLG